MKTCTIRHNKILLAENAKYCDDAFTRGLGLMFTFPWRAAVLVNKKESVVHASIHMFFVFYPLDIIWLDSNQQIVEIKRHVYPFTPFVQPRRKARYVVELPAGDAEGIHQGQTLDIVQETI